MISQDETIKKTSEESDPQVDLSKVTVPAKLQSNINISQKSENEKDDTKLLSKGDLPATKEIQSQKRLLNLPMIGKQLGPNAGSIQ